MQVMMWFYNHRNTLFRKMDDLQRSKIDENAPYAMTRSSQNSDEELSDTESNEEEEDLDVV